MNEILSFWAQWLRPSAGLPTAQWSLLLAVATVAGYVCQRHIGLPKVVGYSVVGTVAGLAGFSGVLWPLQGIGLFLLELGISLILFECGGRIPLRWFRHNPMVLVQSIAESVLTYFAVYWTLIWLTLPEQAAGPLALVALAASPAVLTRVVADTRAAGPVTDRAIVLTTLSTLYALTLGSAQAGLINRQSVTLVDTFYPVVVVLGVSIVVAAVLALVLRMALRFMSPTSENTAMLFLALVAVGLPLLAGGRGGAGVFAGPTGGFLVSWPVAAFVIGWLTERFWSRLTVPLAFGLIFLSSVAVMYGIGNAWLSHAANMSYLKATVAAGPFLPGDFVKALLTAVIAVTVKRSYPIIRAPQSAAV